MMRRNVASIAVAFLLLWATGSSFAAEVGGADTQNELQKLQGTWVMVTGEQDGKKVLDEHVSKSKITYDGNKISLVTPHQSEEIIVAEIVKLDPTKKPKEMHFIRKNGPSAGKTLVGIFEFEGDDQYQFALDPTGALVLTEFAAKDGTGHVRHTWKRVKP